MGKCPANFFRRDFGKNLSSKKKSLKFRSMAVNSSLQFKKIVVPIDFSKISQKALNQAVAFAKQSKATLVLIHVVTFSIAASVEQFSVIDWYQRLIKDAKKNLEKLKQGLDSSISAEIIVETGVPFDVICKIAKKKKADLIVVTTHGYSGLKHAILGSTAERVIRHASCPVLVIR